MFHAQRFELHTCIVVEGLGAFKKKHLLLLTTTTKRDSDVPKLYRFANRGRHSH